MKKRYSLAEDTIDAADLHELIEWLKTNPWLTLGPLTSEFEARWAQWLRSARTTAEPTSPSCPAT